MAVSQPSFPHLFLVLTKTGLTKSVCQRVYIPISGSYNCPPVQWREGERVVFFSSSIDNHWIHGVRRYAWLSPCVSCHCINWYITVLLTLRTWAAWERNLRLSIILPALYVLLWIPSYVINGIFVHSMKCIESIPYLRFYGAHLSRGSQWFTVSRIPGVLYVELCEHQVSYICMDSTGYLGLL